MGMDLMPVNPSNDAPRNDYGVTWGRYNWAGWRYIVDKCNEWGVDTSKFQGANDGALIPAATCRQVADAIEAHLHELPIEEQQWLKPHIALWRTCGGYRQY